MSTTTTTINEAPSKTIAFVEAQLEQYRREGNEALTHAQAMSSFEAAGDYARRAAAAFDKAQALAGLRINLLVIEKN